MMSNSSLTPHNPFNVFFPSMIDTFSNKGFRFKTVDRSTKVIILENFIETNNAAQLFHNFFIRTRLFRTIVQKFKNKKSIKLNKNKISVKNKKSDKKINDNKRLQLSLSDFVRRTRNNDPNASDELGKILIKISEFFDIVNNNISVSPPYIIYSIAHSLKQDLHGDYAFDTNNAKYNYFGFVGIMDSILDYIDDNGLRRTLSYHKDELIICRGDLLHAGCTYSAWNCRIHFYADTKHYDARDINSTYGLDLTEIPRTLPLHQRRSLYLNEKVKPDCIKKKAEKRKLALHLVECRKKKMNNLETVVN